MKAAIAGVNISPVNMEERKNLGIKAGDTVRVHQKIQDKGKTRIQIFEGLVLARKHGTEPGATFTVRKVASGVGVEKIYPLYSPMIDKLEIVKRSKVRRAKLYFIREKVAREIKRQMRRMSLATLSTESGIEAEARIAAEAKVAEEEAVKVAAKVEEEAKTAESAQVEEIVTEAETPEVSKNAEETSAEEAAPEATEEKEETANEAPVEEKTEEETPKEEETKA
jgi:large subunit ribosomal protein L19